MSRKHRTGPTIVQTPAPVAAAAIAEPVQTPFDPTRLATFGRVRRITPTTWAVIAVVALSAILRLIRLTAQSVWYDESFSLVLSSRPLSTLLNGTASDYHPPLSYLVLGGLLRVVAFVSGQKVETLDPALAIAVGRVLSAVAGTVAVYALYRFGRAIFSARTGILAAAIMALAPFQILYTQEIRMYSLEVLLGIWALHTFYYAYRFGAWRHWALFALCGVLLLYNLYFSVFLLLALGLFFVVGWGQSYYEWRTGYLPREPLAPDAATELGGIVARRQPQQPLFGTTEAHAGEGKRLWRQGGLWLLAHVAMLVAYAPWLAVLVNNVSRVQKNGYWIAQPNPLEFFRLVDVFLFNATNLTIPADPPGSHTPLELAALILAVIILIFSLNRVFRWLTRRSERSRLRSRPVSLTLALAAYLVPVVAVFGISYSLVPLYLERSLIFCAAPLYLLCARVAERARRPIFALLALVAGLGVLLPTLWIYYSEPLVQHYQLDLARDYVAAHAQPGDVVIHTNKLSYLPFVYLHAPGTEYVVPEQPGNPHDDLTPGTQDAIGLHFTPLATILSQSQGKRIWLVVTHTFTTDYHLTTVKVPLDHSRQLLDKQVGQWWGEDVYLYAPG